MFMVIIMNVHCHKLSKSPSLSLSLSQDKHCLLELGLPSVEGLLRQGIYPIVIHIRPKNKKHKKLRYVHIILLCMYTKFSATVSTTQTIAT